MTTELLCQGRIYSPAAPDATAMAVSDGIVTWVGQDAPGRVLHPDAQVIDLDGAFVAPAFVDAHVHATSSGLLLDGLDLRGCESLANCLEMIEAQVRAMSTAQPGSTPQRGSAARPAALVWGHGWDETDWPEHRAPTRAELDAIAGETPVYLSRIDAHSALVSTALLDLTPDARGAVGWSDRGPLTMDAHHHARGAARRALDGTQRRASQRAFLRHAAAQGIAAVHECAGPDVSGADDLADLLAVAAEGGLPEVVAYWGEIADPDLATKLGVAGLAGDLFVDGALGSRTAALREPYADTPHTSGNRYLSVERIAEHLIACTHARIPAGFHAIGDDAVTTLVEGLAVAERAVGAPALAACGHRIEHLEMVTEDQARQLARCGVIASVQPMFDACWGGPDGMYAQRLGVDRAAGLNPFAVLAAAGVTLAFGSDSPVTAVDPWATVRAAVHHRSGLGISPRAAFTAHTRAGWRAAGVRDGLTGMLVPGAPATYAVWRAGELRVAGQGISADDRVQRWSTDPRSRVPGLPSVDPDAELPTCVRTVLRGEVIYQRDALPDG
jgi:hypothetical protein